MKKIFHIPKLFAKNVGLILRNKSNDHSPFYMISEIHYDDIPYPARKKLDPDKQTYRVELDFNVAYSQESILTLHKYLIKHEGKGYRKWGYER